LPERKVKMTVPGLGSVEGTEVGLIESVERWTELRLDDGSVLRVKPVVMSVARIDGRYDPQGNPMYLIQASQTMTVASAPDHLRQPGPETPKVQ
jgi:hypothetical protein